MIPGIMSPESLSINRLMRGGLMKILFKNLPGSIPICAVALLLASLAWSVGAEPLNDQDADTNAPNPNLAKMLDQPRKSFKGYSDVLQKLGKPKSVNVTKVPNRHDPSAEDTIRTLTYPGMVVLVYQVPKFKKEFIVGVTLTKRQERFRLPVTVGASRDFALSRLGQPFEDDGDTIFYGVENGNLSIQFVDSKVSRIEWSYDYN
jgi:hypothetical protein